MAHRHKKVEIRTFFKGDTSISLIYIYEYNKLKGVEIY
jgi:hypothetical protein